jgi:nucleoid DNA-binding protein
MELIKKIHLHHKDITQKVLSDVLNTVFTAVKEDISSSNKFTYPGFGTFLVKQRKERVGRNPKNGDKILIKASKTVSFKPAKLFKEDINN